MFLNCFLNIVYLNTALRGVQHGDLQRFGPMSSPVTVAPSRAMLGEDAAAAADIEDFLPNRPPERSAI